MKDRIVNIVLKFFFFNSKTRGCIALWIKIDNEHLFLELRKACRQIDYCCRFADAAFLINTRDYSCISIRKTAFNIAKTHFYLLGSAILMD